MGLACSTAFLTEMVQKGESAPSGPVTVTISAEEQIIQTGLTIIMPNMARVRFRTSRLFSGEIETEVSSALLAKFKKVPIQDRPADPAASNLHA
jgi:hypothetical protein